MKEQKQRVISIAIVLLFLLVILSLNGVRYYDRTFYACGPTDVLSLDRGSYSIVIDTKEPAAYSCCIYYEVNGQERVLARAGMKSGVGGTFRVKLPSNIRNDSIRVVLFDEADNTLPQIDSMRIVRELPVWRTVVYLVLYFVIAGLFHKCFDEQRARILTGLVSVAFLPLYPIYCEAPGRMTFLIMTGVSVLFLAYRKAWTGWDGIVRYVFFLTISLVGLYFCTESSPFYARNPWDDVSIYYSIGRGITQGYVPYRDMFDHKGPMVFFLFALGHLLVPDCFYGVYLLESLCFSGVLYFVHKIYRLYFDEGMSKALTVVSVIFLLDGSFLGYGGSCEEFAMVIFAALLYGYLAYFSGQKECTGRRMAGAGVLSGISFWMKFNMTVCLFVLVGMVMLHKLINRRGIIKDILAFVGGVFAATVPVAGYFLWKDSLGYLKNGYFDANLAYANVKTMGETIATFAGNVLGTIADNPGISLVVVVGLLGFLFTARYMRDILGRIGLALAFCILIGSTYVSYSFLYYYCLVAVFVVLGIIVVTGGITERVTKVKVPDKAAWYLALPCLCILLFFNKNYREAAVFSENFTLLDVCEKEIENAAGGQERTLLLYRNHRAQMMTYAHVRPAARYYFAPNISKNIPEINEEQDRYIHEGISDFVVVDHAEIYPSLMEWGLYQYEQILDWELGNERVQLYHLK